MQPSLGPLGSAGPDACHAANRCQIGLSEWQEKGTTVTKLVFVADGFSQLRHNFLENGPLEILAICARALSLYVLHIPA